MGWECSLYGERRGVYRVLLGKPEGKKPLGRPRIRWEDITMNLQELECGGVDWIGLVKERDGWRVLSGSIKNGEFLD